MSVIAYDTETTGLDLLGPHKMFAYSYQHADGEPMVRRLDGSPARVILNRKELVDLWNDPRPKIMHNAKFDLTATSKYLGYDLTDRPFHDTYIQSHIMRSDQPSHSLKDLTYTYAGIPRDDEAMVKKFVKDGGDYSMVPEFIMDEYQARDAERALLLHLFFYPKIARDPRMLEIYNTELDLIRTTIAIERRGVRIDKSRCLSMIRELEFKRDQVAGKIYDFCGKEINTNKADDVKWLLYTYCKFPILGVTKKKGDASTDKEVLLELREKTNKHPVIELVLQSRSWSRGITILRGYINLADEEGIIHPNLNTCGAKTSRESCSKPNLQNVAKDQVLLNPYPIPARQVFRPRIGFVNFHIDYAGIEYRIGVHYSEDPILGDMIRRGEDGHAFAAATFYRDKFKNDPDPKHKKMLRNAAKNGNFLILYAGSAKALSQTLGLSFEEGKRAYDDYRRAAPAYCNLNRSLMRNAKETGYIETNFGRRLYVPRAEAYVAANYLIQGTAAEILKRAQNRVHKYLQKATGGEAQILLPIHDEIVIEYPRKMLKDAPALFRDIRELMIDFPQFNIPLEIEVEVATEDWAHKHPYPLKGGR